MGFLRTPSQTVGPYFVIGCDRLKTTDLTAPGVTGERIQIRGRVIDGDGAGVPDAMLEVWQANSAGKYAHPEDWQKYHTRYVTPQVFKNALRSELSQ